MKIYEDIKQGTDEWHRLRSGKFTASDFHVLLGSSETKKNLLAKKTAEFNSGGEVVKSDAVVQDGEIIVTVNIRHVLYGG